VNRSSSIGSGAGLVAATVSTLVTLFVALVIPPPWGIGTVLLAVAVATYATGAVVAAVA
jgi:hypothetical protein